MQTDLSAREENRLIKKYLGKTNKPSIARLETGEFIYLPVFNLNF